MKKPAIQEEVTGQKGAGKYAVPEMPGQIKREKERGAGPVPAQGRGIRLQSLAPIVTPRSVDYFGGKEGRLDRRENPFTTMDSGESGGIADQKGSSPDDITPVPAVAEPVGMTLKCCGKARRQSPPRLEGGAELQDMAGEVLRIPPSETDIEPPPLAQKPAVTLQIPAEVDEGGVGGDRALALLLRGHDLFRNLGRDDRLPADAGPKMAGDRTEMAAGADDKAGADSAVHQPAIVPTLEAFNLFTKSLSGMTALQEIMVEFTAHDPVAHDLLIAGLDLGTVDKGGTKSTDRFQDSSLAILMRLDPEAGKNRGGNPAGTGLGARKDRLIEEKDIEPRRCQAGGTG